MSRPLNVTVNQLALDVLTNMRRADRRRYVLGIVGVPGAGKTTLAEELAEKINGAVGDGFAVVLAMDGFHLPNAELDARGLRSRKGSPPSYDAAGFVELVRAARQQKADDEPIGVPGYCRQVHEPVADAFTIDPMCGLVIVEGQYLLLDEQPWAAIRGLLDEAWYIDIDLEESMARTKARHERGGCTDEQAQRKVDENDRPNARLIKTTRPRADRTLTL